MAKQDYERLELNLILFDSTDIVTASPNNPGGDEFGEDIPDWDWGE